MQAFNRFDGWVISLVDRFTGDMEARGVRLPLILREIVMAQMAISVVLPVAGLLDGHVLGSVIWALYASFLLPGRYAAWKILDRDAKAEWTETLSRRYFSRADFYRQNPGPRLMGWFFVVTAAVLVWVSIQMDVFSQADILLTVLFTVDQVRAYFDCAIPMPPSQRSRRLVPSVV